MSKLSPLIVFISFLLVSHILISAAAARPNPTHDDVAFVKTQNMNEDFFEDAGCKGIGEEACLEKTASNAHTDYIYTQPHPPQEP